MKYGIAHFTIPWWVVAVAIIAVAVLVFWMLDRRKN
jgi:hypothetical protein